MNNISAFVDKETEKATLELTYILDNIELPDGVQLTINNLNNAESGVLRSRKGEKIIDISLAHCFSLEDVVRELIGLVAARK